MKKIITYQLLTLLMLITCTSGSLFAQNQNPRLYVSGYVSSDANMMVSVSGTKTIEGNVVIAEMNGKKTEMRTNKNGQATLDFSAIAAGLTVPTVAIIKSYDRRGNLISTANTTVQPAIRQMTMSPVLENLPANLSNNEMVTISGHNLNAAAKLSIGSQLQETLTASDREMTVFTNSKTGQQPVSVNTPNGVSQRQMVNIYSLDFVLPKNSISPAENVQARVQYESIPVGTKLIFTNKSPGTINMAIPGCTGTGTQNVYKVSSTSGTMPVNITGISRGNFTIALDFNFIDQLAKPARGSEIYYDIKQNPCDSIKAVIAKLEDSLKKLKDSLNGLEHKKKLLDDAIRGFGADKKEAAAKAKKENAKAKRETADKLDDKATDAEKEAAEAKEKAESEKAAAEADMAKWNELAGKWKALEEKIDKEKNGAEKKKLKEELDAIKKSCQELNKSANEHAANARKAKQHADLKDSEAKRLREQAKKLRAEADKLDKEADEFEKEAEEMKKGAVSEDNEKNKTELDKTKGQIEKLKDTIKKLKEDLKKAKDAKDAMKDCK